MTSAIPLRRSGVNQPSALSLLEDTHIEQEKTDESNEDIDTSGNTSRDKSVDTKCHLLDCPPEVRNLIYHFLAPLLAAHNFTCGTIRELVEHRRGKLAVLRSCKSVYKEFHGIYFSSKKWKIVCGDYRYVSDWADGRIARHVITDPFFVLKKLLGPIKSEIYGGLQYYGVTSVAVKCCLKSIRFVRFDTLCDELLEDTKLPLESFREGVRQFLQIFKLRNVPNELQDLSINFEVDMFSRYAISSWGCPSKKLSQMIGILREELQTFMYGFVGNLHLEISFEEEPFQDFSRSAWYQNGICIQDISSKLEQLESSPFDLAHFSDYAAKEFILEHILPHRSGTKFSIFHDDGDDDQGDDEDFGLTPMFGDN